MDRYLSVAEMIAIEKAADAAGHTYAKMMAFAGRSLAEKIVEFYGQKNHPAVLGLVGTGNNGGDTLVALKLLLELGWDCTAYLISNRMEENLTIDFLNAGGKTFHLEQDAGYQRLRWLLSENDILIDGLLGTGIKLPLRPPINELLRVVREYVETSDISLNIVAVDCPSGIDCDTGAAADDCLSADLTVCMAAVKQGLLRLPAFSYLGRLFVGDIGLPDGLPEMDRISRFVINEDFVDGLFPIRTLDSYKGTFGTVLVIAGSTKLPGAALLAGKAAFRSGAGWVNIGVPEELQPSLISAFPEATWLPLPGDNVGLIEEAAKVIHQAISKENVVLVGPGLGLDSGVRDFMPGLLSEPLPPLVVDADGLKLLSYIQDWWKKLPEDSILTPHPGEMSALTGLSISEIQEDRISFAEKFAKLWGHVVVLKGAFTVVADPGGKTAVLPVASPALARAGTGDVLAGIIAGLKAQGMTSYNAATAGVWLHAEAGLSAAELRGSTAGVLAGDLIKILPALLPY